MNDLNSKNWFEDWFDSPYYHLLYQNRDFNEAELFIGNLTRFLKLKQGSEVMDLACGKGRHACVLNKLGFKVVGVDLAAKSIEAARDHENENLHFFVHDMREVLTGYRFDAIFNLFTSFGYFEEETQNEQVLNAVNQMLAPKGLLVIDFMNAQKVIRNLVAHEQKSCTQVSFDLKRTFNGTHILKHIRFEVEGKTFEFEERVQALGLDQFQRLLTTCGFELLHSFGSYQLEAFDAGNSDRLILIAAKK